MENKSELCHTCSKSEFCNPRRNYGITAIKCKKYIERKIKKIKEKRQ
jgi:hypothetical protein